jgi:hypothetical protein
VFTFTITQVLTSVLFLCVLHDLMCPHCKRLVFLCKPCLCELCSAVWWEQQLYSMVTILFVVSLRSLHAEKVCVYQLSTEFTFYFQLLYTTWVKQTSDSNNLAWLFCWFQIFFLEKCKKSMFKCEERYVLLTSLVQLKVSLGKYCAYIMQK